MTAEVSSLFLRRGLVLLSQYLIFIPPNASSDMQFYTVLTVSCPSLEQRDWDINQWDIIVYICNIIHLMLLVDLKTTKCGWNMLPNEKIISTPTTKLCWWWLSTNSSVRQHEEMPNIRFMLELVHQRVQILFFSRYIHNTLMVFVGCDSSVGIVTHYELDGPGIKSRWRRDTPLLTSQPTVQWVLGLFPRG
jgi:hypothetical protein